MTGTEARQLGRSQGAEPPRAPTHTRPALCRLAGGGKWQNYLLAAVITEDSQVFKQQQVFLAIKTQTY